MCRTMNCFAIGILPTLVLQKVDKASSYLFSYNLPFIYNQMSYIILQFAPQCVAFLIF